MITQTSKPITIFIMKTIKLTAMICSFLMLSYCSEDDGGPKEQEVPNAEETGIFLVQDLHLRYLRQQIDILAEKIIEAEKAVNEKPDDLELQAVLKELKEIQGMNLGQLDFVNSQIETIFGQNNELIGRVPRVVPPLPDPPNPCNCLIPLDLSRLKNILSIDKEGVEIIVRAENQEVVGVFGDADTFEGTDLIAFSLDGEIDFSGNVAIEIKIPFEPGVDGKASFSVSGKL